MSHLQVTLNLTLAISNLTESHQALSIISRAITILTPSTRPTYLVANLSHRSFYPSAAGYQRLAFGGVGCSPFAQQINEQLSRGISKVD